MTLEHRTWSKAIIARGGSRCAVCGASGVRLFADHIVEIKDGGAPLDLANGQALCGRHHTLKTIAARAGRPMPANAARGAGV